VRSTEAKQCGSLDDEEVIEQVGLPSWWKPEWLHIGGPIQPPAEAMETTEMLPGGAVQEKWPGAWKGIPNSKTGKRDMQHKVCLQMVNKIPFVCKWKLFFHSIY